MKNFIWLTPLIVLMLTQFNNCSPYAQTDASELSSLGDLVCDSDCITPTPSNLAISPVLIDGAVLRVGPALGDFDIAGTCNEGGYPYNVITWDLYDASNMKVRDSSGTNAVTSCVNGRFKAYVKLTSIASDGVNRTGLYTNGVANSRQQYTVQLTIYGRLVQQGAIQMGGNNRQPVTLVGVQ